MYTIPMHTTLAYLVYAAIGCLAGISMGIVGIGAGIITVPLLIYTGMDIKSAVGVSLFMQLLPQSLPGLIVYDRGGHVPYVPATIVVGGSLVGILIGATIVHHEYISKEMTYKLLSVLLIVVAAVFAKTHLLA
jgi:uncharacterized membrane protein YfcA